MNLDKNYRIVYDENNVILQFFEQREKKQKDGTKIDFEFTENFYYPNMKTALISFLMRSLQGSASVEEVLQEIRRVESIISNIK